MSTCNSVSVPFGEDEFSKNPSNKHTEETPIERQLVVLALAVVIRTDVTYAVIVFSLWISFFETISVQ